MRVEDVHVLKPEPAQALIKARQQVLARASIAVGARPHAPARLGRDDELIPVWAEVAGQQLPECRLRCAIGRPVVVREVEVGDPEIEGPAQYGARVLEGAGGAELLPEAEGDRGQLKPAPATASVADGVVTMIVGDVAHEPPRQSP